MPHILYVMPKPEVVSKVVSLIPDDWSWKGSLDASKSQYEREAVAKNTSLAIDVHGSKIESWGSGKYDLLALNQGKLASHLEINYLGSEPINNIEQGLNSLLTHYVSQGHRGDIEAWSQKHTIMGVNNPMGETFQERVKFDYEREKIIISWDPKYHGKRENLDAFVEGMSELGLREILL